MESKEQIIIIWLRRRIYELYAEANNKMKKALACGNKIEADKIGDHYKTITDFLENEIERLKEVI